MARRKQIKCRAAALELNCQVAGLFVELHGQFRIVLLRMHPSPTACDRLVQWGSVSPHRSTYFSSDSVGRDEAIRDLSLIKTRA